MADKNYFNRLDTPILLKTLSYIEPIDLANLAKTDIRIRNNIASNRMQLSPYGAILMTTGQSYFFYKYNKQEKIIKCHTIDEIRKFFGKMLRDPPLMVGRFNNFPFNGVKQELLDCMENAVTLMDIAEINHESALENISSVVKSHNLCVISIRLTFGGIPSCAFDNLIPLIKNSDELIIFPSKLGNEYGALIKFLHENRILRTLQKLVVSNQSVCCHKRSTCPTKCLILKELKVFDKIQILELPIEEHFSEQFARHFNSKLMSFATKTYEFAVVNQFNWKFTVLGKPSNFLNIDRWFYGCKQSQYSSYNAEEDCYIFINKNTGKSVTFSILQDQCNTAIVLFQSM